MKGDSARVRWSPGPRSGGLPPYKVLRPQPGVDLFGWAINGKPTAVVTHWYDGRTAPCLGGSEFCEPCRAGCGTRTEAFLPLFWSEGSKVVIAAISHDAFLNCKPFHVPDANLRGWWVRLARMGARRNSKVKITLDQRHRDYPIPEPFDVRPWLLRMWGWPVEAASDLAGGKDGAA